MGKIVDQTCSKIVTNEGLRLFRRVSKVEMPNGKYRYPVDYYDATPGVVQVSATELENLKVPGYKVLI